MRKTAGPRNILFLPFAFQHDFHVGIAQYAGKHGWSLNADMAWTGKIPYGWHGDGIITLLIDEDVAERFTLQFGVPVVDLTNNRPHLPIPRVNKDNHAIGRLGAEHFLTHGWHSFAFFSRVNSHVSRLRLNGYRQMIERQGLRCHELVWPVLNPGQDATWDHVCKWLVQALVKLPKPLALMAYSDYDAALAMEACLTAGYTVPGEVGILGVDNLAEVCPCQPVTLSSVETATVIVGYEAAKLLDQLMDGEPEPEAPRLIPPGGVVQRASTNRLVLRSPQMQRAIRIIDECLTAPFSMDQIAEAAGVSRQGMYKMFERELHQTPTEYVLHKRMELARELLENTHESTGEIARRCGLPVLSTFIRQFTLNHGKTPGEWRKAIRNQGGGK